MLLSAFLRGVICGTNVSTIIISANLPSSIEPVFKPNSFAPFLVVGGVPITLQPLFAILAGLVLGSRLGAISITVYTLLGLVGAPVFAKFSGGFSSILSPTFGFIITFILSAYVAGKMVDVRRTKSMYIAAALVGIAINYLLGTNWMYYAYKLWASAPEGFTYKMAWLWMVPPFPKDIILAVLAGIFGFRLQKIIKVGH